MPLVLWDPLNAPLFNVEFRSKSLDLRVKTFPLHERLARYGASFSI